MIIKRVNGMTMIEAMIAITIVSILTLIAVPSFLNLIQRYRLSAATEHLRYFLDFARSEAIKRNANVYVSFSTGDTWCYGANPTSSCDCNTAGSCTLGTVTYDSAQRFSLSTSGLSSNAIYFEGTHGAANAAGSVTFTQYNQSAPLLTISVSRLGNLTMCSTGISGYAAC